LDGDKQAARFCLGYFPFLVSNIVMGIINPRIYFAIEKIYKLYRSEK
jgi:hypothetical protein